MFFFLYVFFFPLLTDLCVCLRVTTCQGGAADGLTFCGADSGLPLSSKNKTKIVTWGCAASIGAAAEIERKRRNVFHILLQMTGLGSAWPDERERNSMSTRVSSQRVWSLVLVNYCVGPSGMLCFFLVGLLLLQSNRSQRFFH